MIVPFYGDKITMMQLTNCLAIAIAVHHLKKIVIFHPQSKNN